MTQPYRLPPRGVDGAPRFDPIQPHTLLDFFEGLEYMLEEAAVDDDEERTGHAVGTYEEFKNRAPRVLSPRDVPYTVEQVTEAVEFVLDSLHEDISSFSVAASTTVTIKANPTTESVSARVETEAQKLELARSALVTMMRAVTLLLTTASASRPRG
ncbi:hypothetical protein C8Q79DRAFT_1011476 [Trametes meyenii]|nr:hypothetical protein C8Q79DRAFT_1011476 [Trametes meyenii]